MAKRFRAWKSAFGLLCGGWLLASAALAGEVRPPIEEVLPPHFSWGTAAFSGVGNWPERMKKEHGIDWSFLYIYTFPNSHSDGYVTQRIRRCEKMGAIMVVTFYGLLQLGREQGFSGNESGVVNKIVRNEAAMKNYFEEVVYFLKLTNRARCPIIFHSEPDSWYFLQWQGTMETHDPSEVQVMVKSSGMPDVADFPDNVVGFAKAHLHLRDKYAPRTYMGFHCKSGVGAWIPQQTVKYVKQIGLDEWDILISDGIGTMYSTKKSGWWDAWDERLQKRYLTWFGSITKATGRKFIHWQSVVGQSDYTLLPDYPSKERVSDYIKAGSVACLLDMRVPAGGTPDEDGHSDPNHGYTANPPADHPAQRTVAALVERLRRYYEKPIRWRDPGKVASRAARKPKERKPIILPDGTEIIIVGGFPVRRKRKAAPVADGETPAASSAESSGPKDEGPEAAPARRRPPKPKPPELDESPKEPKEPPEVSRMFKEAESFFIDGDSDKAAELFRKIVAEHPGTPSATKAAEYLEIVE